MIEARSLTRQFKNVLAVSHLTLTVAGGSLLALLGPNGAGKTTTVRMLAGLLAPTQGTARVGGYDVVRNPEAVRSCIGMVTDTPGLFEQMPLASYLDFVGRMYGIPVDVRTRRIDELLTFFELTEQRKKKMSGFSKGMKQKVALARALIHNPMVLFLDEPTSGLDPQSSRNVRELIFVLKRSGRSVILCTHDLDEAERLADEIAIIRKGRIVAQGTASALRTDASGSSVVHITFTKPVIGASEIVQSIDGISHIKTQTQASILEYRTTQPETINPVVLSALITAGAQISTVHCTLSSLEDAYFSALSDDHQETHSIVYKGK